MPDLSFTPPSQGYTGWAIDNSRGELDIVTSDGRLIAWNLTTHAIDFQINIGGSPTTIALSIDGRYALVGDASQTAGSDFNHVVDHLSRIDLTTGAVQPLSFEVWWTDGRIGDLATTNDGTVVIALEQGKSSGQHAFTFNLNQANPVFHGLDGFGFTGLGEHTLLRTSNEGDYVLVAGSYLVRGGVVASNTSWDDAGFGYWRTGDVSQSHGLVISREMGAIAALDLQMHVVADLSRFETNGEITGVAFDPTGSRAYLWQGSQSHIFVVETQSWQEVGAIDVTSTTPPNAFPLPYGMDLTSDDRFLVLDTFQGLEVVDINARQYTQLAAVYLRGGQQADTLVGGAGDDTIDGANGDNVLRGGYGSDAIWGGDGFDQMQGNQGQDTEHGGAGGDWVVGGKGSDQLFGDAGNDVLNGNLGTDTCQGGDGDDIVRGGQGDDSLSGDAGDDLIFGDLGSDTLAGGAGADSFYISVRLEGAHDRIVDFNAAEGDRVRLDAGVAFAVRQQGADTIVTIQGEFSYDLTLVGVQATALPPGSIVVG